MYSVFPEDQSEIVNSSITKEIDRINNELDVKPFAYWLFENTQASDTLSTWAYYNTTSNIQNDDVYARNVKRAKITVGHGTIGTIINSDELEYIADTYEDPRGTVIETDIYYNHKKALLYRLKNEDNVRFAAIILFYEDSVAMNEGIKENVKNEIDKSINVFWLTHLINQKEEFLNILTQTNSIIDSNITFKDFMKSSFYELNNKGLLPAPYVEIVREDFLINKLHPSIVNNISNELFLCYFSEIKNTCNICFVNNGNNVINTDCSYDKDILSKFFNIKYTKITRIINEHELHFLVDSKSELVLINKIVDRFLNNRDKGFELSDNLSSLVIDKKQNERIINLIEEKNLIEAKVIGFYITRIERKDLVYRITNVSGTGMNNINRQRFSTPANILPLFECLENIEIFKYYTPAYFIGKKDLNLEIKKVETQIEQNISYKEDNIEKQILIRWSKAEGTKRLVSKVWVNDDLYLGGIENEISNNEKGKSSILSSIGINPDEPIEFEYRNFMIRFYNKHGLEEYELDGNVKQYYKQQIDDFLIYKLNLDTKKAAIKSAKAAIMARNISHNLGSHVIYYVKTALESFEDIHTFPHLMELDKVGDEFRIPSKLFHQINDEISNAEKQEIEITAPFLRGLIHFLNYVQERHDYIASISNSHIPYSGSVNFKDFVFDIILPDKKIERHKEGDEELNKYKQQNLLLDYIAKSEKIGRSNINIIYKTRGRKGYFCPSLSEKSDNEESNRHLVDLRNIELSLPSGIMGRQAFFSIFENFIRNTAKHKNEKDPEKDLEIVFSVKKKPKKGFYVFRLYNTKSIITNDILKDKINVALSDDYEKNGELNSKYKGIKEMRISAAWLRGLQVENIDEKNVDGDPLLKTFLINTETEKKVRNGNDGALCYQFKVPMSKKMVIVTNKNNIIIDNEDQDQDNYDIISPKDYIKKTTLKKYRLTVIDGSLSEKDISLVLEHTPTRTVKHKIENDESIKLDEFYLRLYKVWIASFSKEGNDINSLSVVVEDTALAELPETKIASKGIIAQSAFTENDYPNGNFVIYRTHNDTEADFNVFKKNAMVYHRTLFVEGISGHNSTDRLIRHEDYTAEWRLKILESALVKITIVDERLFDTYKSEVKEKDKQVTEQDILDNCESKESLLSFLNIKFPTIDFENEKLSKSLLFVIENKDNLIKEDYGKHIKRQIIKLHNSIKVQLKKSNNNLELLDKKRIKIFNIVNNRILNINTEFVEVVDPVNYVFVHQGIIEKMKEQGDINDRFVKFMNMFPVSENGAYIVHSGRANPSNLPNGVSFVQFSSLEAALNDCKFSLSEIVFNAIKE